MSKKESNPGPPKGVKKPPPPLVPPGKKGRKIWKAIISKELILSIAGLPADSEITGIGFAENIIRGKIYQTQDILIRAVEKEKP